MSTDLHRKVRPEHLRRDAFIYVRQSSPGQILNNTESTKRQYALRDRAVALGWPIERIHTIDDDQGHTAVRAHQREGFEYLVSEVAVGHAGILLGLEVSRLARDNVAWQRLLQVCALTGCLVGDEDGVYDPCQFNDRLLLGLKGAISEAEMHVLTERLVGGQRSKARRGALEVPLPIGLVYNAAGTVVLDPDPRIQASVRRIFDTFRETHSAIAVETRFRHEGLEFPRRIRRRGGTRQVIFAALGRGQILQILHNPRYAGAYVYGRRPLVRTPEVTKQVTVPRKDWRVLIPEAHPGYIGFEEFESNQQILEKNHAQVILRRASLQGQKPREALLMGRVLCGTCGSRMQVHSEARQGQFVRFYACPKTDRSRTACRRIGAPEVDAAIGTLLLETVTATAVNSALTVQDEVRRGLQRGEAARHRELAQARRAADLKRRRFLACDPDHRLVAGTLEADWNEALQRLDALQQQHGGQGHADPGQIDADARARLAALAQDFPQIWNDPKTEPAERRRVVGLLIEDVTLIHGDPITVHVRWRAGRSTSLTVQKHKPMAYARKTRPEVIKALDALLENCTDIEAARQLNAQGHRSWQGKRFDNKSVRGLRILNGLKSSRERWLAKGFLTSEQVARKLGIAVSGVRRLAREGQLPHQHYAASSDCVFAPLNGLRVVRQRNGRYVLKR